MTVGETIIPPSGRLSRIREWIPVAILLLTGISNGVLYESVVTDEHARMIIAFNFFLSMAAILFCLRKHLPFFRKSPESLPATGQNQFVLFSAYETDQEGNLVLENNAQDKRCSDLPPEEVFNYANTFLN